MVTSTRKLLVLSVEVAFLCVLFVKWPAFNPFTYLWQSSQGDDDGAYQKIGLLQDFQSKGQPDTTAVILNWSRFSNVLRISSLLCSPELDGIISEVYIWNNSPKKISHQDFNSTGCSVNKLRIHNSPSNLLFQARYLACSEAQTTYCYTQDDDYLVEPEAIQALHARITQSPANKAIHLLPSHEHMSTSLRELYVQKPPGGYSKAVSTSFAWLGHGTIFRRTEAIDFLNTMRALQVSEEQMEMADNYFTILSNRVPEVWFDQGSELGGGQPFTQGSVGDLRNKRHIRYALQYLDKISRGEIRDRLPYVTEGTRQPASYVQRAVCKKAQCLMETNIKMLPKYVGHVSDTVENMLVLEARSASVLEASGKSLYIDHPPSHAIDSHRGSYFQSPRPAKRGDWISLDFFNDVFAVQKWATVEMVWLVDEDTVSTLKSGVLESSLYNAAWTPAETPCWCTVRDANTGVHECVFTINSTRSDGGEHASRFRVRVQDDQQTPWKVHEVLMRGQRE